MLRIAPFIVCWFIWVYFGDCGRKNEIGTRISWVEEKLRWH